jgi:hypothetical protein
MPMMDKPIPVCVFNKEQNQPQTQTAKVTAKISLKLNLRTLRTLPDTIIASQNKLKVQLKPKLNTQNQEQPLKLQLKLKANPLKIKLKPNLLPNSILKQSTGNIKIAPKPFEIDAESESESESEHEHEPAPKSTHEHESESESDVELDDDATKTPEVYERWINGAQMLISVDNKYIYDLQSREHIGTVMDESTIEWIDE